MAVILPVPSGDSVPNAHVVEIKYVWVNLVAVGGDTDLQPRVACVVARQGHPHSVDDECIILPDLHHAAELSGQSLVGSDSYPLVGWERHFFRRNLLEVPPEAPLTEVRFEPPSFGPGEVEPATR